jgi:hypothetical protein
MKPPKKRKTIGSANGAAASAGLLTASEGNRITGTSAVTARGTASVTHHTAISTPTAATRHAVGGSPLGGGSTISSRNVTGPSAEPIRAALPMLGYSSAPNLGGTRRTAYGGRRGTVDATLPVSARFMAPQLWVARTSRCAPTHSAYRTISSAILSPQSASPCQFISGALPAPLGSMTT